MNGFAILPELDEQDCHQLFGSVRSPSPAAPMLHRYGAITRRQRPAAPLLGIIQDGLM
jgi:hypothetical protein